MCLFRPSPRGSAFESQITYPAGLSELVLFSGPALISSTRGWNATCTGSCNSSPIQNSKKVASWTVLILMYSDRIVPAGTMSPWATQWYQTNRQTPVEVLVSDRPWMDAVEVRNKPVAIALVDRAGSRSQKSFFSFSSKPSMNPSKYRLGMGVRWVLRGR